MKTIRVLMCVSVAACLGTFTSGCSGSDTEIQSAGTTPSNLSPQEKILRAAGSGDVSTLKSLIKSDASLVKVTGFGGMTPLHAAAAEGQNSAVRFLLEQGADPKAVDENSSTPVDAALGGIHKDTAKILTDWIASHGGEAADSQ